MIKILTFQIDIEELEKKIDTLSSWDDWEIIDKKIFRSEEWPESSLEKVEEDLARTSEIIEGIEWISTTNSYNVSPEILQLYEKTRWRVFNKLEPDAEKENRNHPEWYGKLCVYCRRWTKEYQSDKCPKCGNDLLPLSLND